MSSTITRTFPDPDNEGEWIVLDFAQEVVGYTRAYVCKDTCVGTIIKSTQGNVWYVWTLPFLTLEGGEDDFECVGSFLDYIEAVDFLTDHYAYIIREGLL